MSAEMGPPTPDPTSQTRIAELRRSLGARAAGLWEVRGDRLEQLAFDPHPEMPERVAHAFAEATRSVPLDRVGLGIVLAARTAEVTFSRTAELPADSGSGSWLRSFAAERSVAVPLADARGTVRRVVSIALAAGAPEDEEVADRLRRAAGTDRWSC